MLETSLVLLLLLTTLIATLDFSRVLFTHQVLVDRVRIGLRWGMINPWDGTGDKIANVVMYNQPTASQNPAYAGLTRSNIQVSYSPPTAANPNDVSVRIAIVNFKYTFFTPFISGTYTSGAGVTSSTPVTYH